MTTTVDKLAPYEGQPVLGTVVKITNTGDGLSEALSIEPDKFSMGQRLTVVLDVEVVGHSYRQVKKAPGCVELVHTLRAGTAVIVDDELIQDALDAQAEKNRLAAEERQGIQRFDFTNVEALREAHENGKHQAGLVVGCPECDLEIEEMERERGGD